MGIHCKWVGPKIQPKKQIAVSVQVEYHYNPVDLMGTSSWKITNCEIYDNYPIVSHETLEFYFRV